jgi:hypothetical protein
MGVINENCNPPAENDEYEIYARCFETKPSDCLIGDPEIFTSLRWVQKLPEDIAEELGLLDCYIPTGAELPDCCPEPLSILALQKTESLDIVARQKTELVGTNLRNLISWFVWSKKARQCLTCKNREATMNLWGADKCERNIEIIVGWLKESAHENNLPFSERIARAFIRKAIQSSRN